MTLTGVFNVFVNQKFLISNYHGKASDSAIDDAEGIEHGFAWRGVGSA